MPEVDADTIADALAGPGWIVIDDFIDASLAANLCAEARAADLQPAAVGVDTTRQLLPELRGDRTLWFETDTASAPQQVLLACFDALRLGLNRRLFAGLDSVECHYAHYPPGAAYRRHRDRFRADDRRVVSCVLYLNPDWHADSGGALRLYDDTDAPLSDVLPQAGRAALFLSDRFPHEVLAATRDRYSIAAWFLRRAQPRGR